jgi:FtsP/CotA-like multicopper oxidase with cupredoxin domain
MLRLPRPLLLLTLTVAGTLALLTACTSSPSTSPEQSPTAPASSTSPSSTGPSSAGASPTASVSSASPSTDAEALTLNITIANHQVSPNGDKINVTKGQTVVLKVTSDTDDEVHAHTAGDGYELEVKAGKSATGSFVAADTGTFEVESHHLDKIIAILVVR